MFPCQHAKEGEKTSPSLSPLQGFPLDPCIVSPTEVSRWALFLCPQRSDIFRNRWRPYLVSIAPGNSQASIIYSSAQSFRHQCLWAHGCCPTSFQTLMTTAGEHHKDVASHSDHSTQLGREPHHGWSWGRLRGSVPLLSLLALTRSTGFTCH